MRIVLFGAGASYGCGGVAPAPPPIGGSLFPALRRLYANWRSIPREIATLFERHFETGMAEVIEKHGFAVGPLMQEMARFFAIFHIQNQSQNLYVELLKRAHRRSDIIWSTLNYECLLELAAAHLTWPVAYFADPVEITERAVPVWKLHGSCNFKITGLEATRGVSYSGTGVVFGGSIQPIDPGQVSAHYSGNTALYPAMALYAAGKPISMSPSPIQDAQRRWNEHVRESDRVLIIGVRPYPADKHLWTSLAETPAEVAVVGSHKQYEAWAKAHRADGVVRILGDKWLEASGEAATFLIEG